MNAGISDQLLHFVKDDVANNIIPGQLQLIVSGGSRGGARAPLILGKKEEMTEGKMGDRASKSRPPPPPLAQGLDPPLIVATNDAFDI